MNARELTADLACERGTEPGEIRIADDATRLCRAREQTLHREWRADDALVGAFGDRLGDKHADRVRGLDAGEFARPIEAHGKARDRIRPEHQGVRAGARAAVDHRMNAPVFLHGTAGEEIGARDLDA